MLLRHVWYLQFELAYRGFVRGDEEISFVVICTCLEFVFWIWHHLWVHLASIGTFGSSFLDNLHFVLLVRLLFDLALCICGLGDVLSRWRLVKDLYLVDC